MKQIADKFEFLSVDAISPLDSQKALMYADTRKSFISYLRSEGRLNESGGFAEGSIKSKARRMHQIHEWVWKTFETPTIELKPAHADEFVQALAADEFTKNDGSAYAGNSKGKFNDILKAYFEWKNISWEPDIAFSDKRGDHNKPDIFTRPELVDIWNASFEINSLPAYNNLSPNEREDWYNYFSQYLGKSKDELGPETWRDVNNFSVPSLIRTTRGAGWRPAMIGRLEVGMYDPQTKKIRIPAEAAVKNNTSWDQQLTDEGAAALERWLEQRSNIDKYANSDKIWLNRKGNPHSSGTLNDLLNKLLDEAGIQVGGRKIVWTSFRHSKGTYVYDETTDLRAVADVLRQRSTESAAWYVHQTPEMARKLANIA